MDGPVVVVGIGRSGSTWVADVISRVTGGIMLNEVLHPCIFLRDGDLRFGIRPRRQLTTLMRAALRGEIYDPWLMRNYFAPLARADHAQVRATFEAGPVVGAKERYCCYAMRWLLREVTPNAVFVARRPEPVVASILRRPSYWGWGFPAEYHMQVDRGAGSPAADGTLVASVRREAARAETMVERAAVLWAAAHAAVLHDLTELGERFWWYEDLVADPHGAYPELFARLGLTYDASLAEVERPSLTTAPANERQLDDGDRATIERITAHVLDALTAASQPARIA